MKNFICFYIVVTNSIFNDKAINPFSLFSKKYSTKLYSALLLNLIEIISKYNLNTKIVLCFNGLDKDLIPPDYSLKNINTEFYFFETDKVENELLNLFEKNSGDFHKQIFLSSNFIGLLNEKLELFNNILSIEDEVVIVGKTNHNKICMIGFNFFTIFPSSVLNINSSFDSSLKKVNKINAQLYAFNDFHSIEVMNDFKKLYKTLSIKENYNLCSQYIHDKLTQIFIEYKDLL